MHSAAGSSNGRTPGFGPGYLGSNPSPAAMCVNVVDEITNARPSPCLPARSFNEGGTGS